MPRPPSNRELLAPFALPYLAYVLPGAIGLEAGAAYALRWLLVVAALAWAWRWVAPRADRGRAAGSLLLGAGGGALGLGLWLLLLAPFRDAAGEAWSTPAWFARASSATLLAPLVEELLFRGYAFGLACQWQRERRAGAAGALARSLDDRSVHDLDPHAWTAAAVVAPTLLFALGHSPGEWTAAVGYGLLVTFLRIARGDLLAPIAAHAATNLGLALWVLTRADWGYW